MSSHRRVHSGLIVASSILGACFSVLILGASRGQATDAGLPGSAATDFSLRDDRGAFHGLGEWRTKCVVLVVARQDAVGIAKATAAVNQVCDTFVRDANVGIVGVQVAGDAGLLDAAVRTPGELQARCPQLQTLQDADGSVARAYRVNEVPTAFVIDAAGLIRGRVPLNGDGSAVAVSEIVSSLRPAGTGFSGLPQVQ